MASIWDSFDAQAAPKAGVWSEFDDDDSGIRRVGDLGLDLAKGVVGLGEAVVGIADLVSLGAAGEALSAIGYDPKATRSFLSDYYSRQRKRANEQVEGAEGFVDTAYELLANPSTLAGHIAEAVPATLGIAGLGRMVAMRAFETARTGALAAGKTAEEATKVGIAAVEAALPRVLTTVSAAEGAQAAGSIAETARQEGREWADYVLPSVGAGVTTGVIGRTAGALAPKMGLGGDLEASIATTGMGVPKAQAGGLVASAMRGAAREGVLEELPQSVGEQAFQNAALDKDPTEGLGGAAATGLLVGAGMGGAHAALSRDPEERDTARAVDNIARSRDLETAIAAAMAATAPGPIVPPAPPSAPGIVAGAMAPEAPQTAMGLAMSRALQAKREREQQPVSSGSIRKELSPAQEHVAALSIPPGRDPLGRVEPTLGAPAGDGLQDSISQVGKPEVAPEAAIPPRGNVELPAPTVDEAAAEAATSPENDRKATDAMLRANNAKLARTELPGVDVTIKYAAGSERIDENNDPPKFRTLMRGIHYGELDRTTGADGDKLDLVLKEGTPTTFDGTVYVLNQGSKEAFDEHKAFAGFASQDDARQAYIENFGGREAEKRIRSIVALPFQAFKEWAFHPTRGPDKGELVLPATHYLDDKHMVRVVDPRQPTPKGATTFTSFEAAGAARVTRLKAQAKEKKRLDIDRDSLVDAVIKLGGLSMTERLDTLGDDKAQRQLPGVGYLFTKKGTGADDMATLLGQYGYLSQAELDDVDGGVAALKEKLKEEFGGQRRHWSMNSDAALREEADRRRQLEEDQAAAEAADVGAPPEDWDTLSDEEKDARLAEIYGQDPAAPSEAEGEGDDARALGPREREPGEDDDAGEAGGEAQAVKRSRGGSAAFEPHPYPPSDEPKHQVRHIARGIRENVQWAIKVAAKEMASGLPKNAVFVPVPGHGGKATSTRRLALEIARHAGGIMSDSLSSEARESQYELEKAGKPRLKADELKIRLVTDLPRGRPVYVVDNVMGSGETMKAALAAVRKARHIEDPQPLVYARTVAEPKASRGGIVGRELALSSAITALDNIIPSYEAIGALDHARLMRGMRLELQRLLDNPDAIFYQPPLPIETPLLEALKKNEQLHAQGKFLESPFDHDPNERWPEKWFNRLRAEHGEGWIAKAKQALDEMDLSRLERPERTPQGTEKGEGTWRLYLSRNLADEMRIALLKHELGEVVPPTRPKASRGGESPEQALAELAGQVELLERVVDRAYERGAAAAEDLDALLADMKGHLLAAYDERAEDLDTSEDLEPDEIDFSTVEEELRVAYIDWQHGGPRYGGREEARAAMRAIVRDAGGTATEAEAFRAAADAYSATVARRLRKAQASRSADPRARRVGARPARQGVGRKAFEARLVEAFGSGIKRLFGSGLFKFTADAAGLPVRLRAYYGPGTEALYDPAGNGGTGAIWFIGSELAPERVAPVVLHELGEHYGLQQLLGKRGLEQLYDAVKGSRDNAVVKAAWAYVQERYPDLEEGGAEFVSEVVARVGESPQALKLPFFRRLVAAVREFLIRLGLRAGLVREISDADIVLLVTASARRAIAGAVPRAHNGAGEVSEATAGSDRDRRQAPGERDLRAPAAVPSRSIGGFLWRLLTGRRARKAAQAPKPQAEAQKPVVEANKNVTARPGANFRRLNALLGAKLYGEPKDIARVSVKEMVQNSFDAIKTLIDKGELAKGYLSIDVDQDARTITVADNGSGMRPQTLATSFLQIAATEKETERSSGGLGIAKGLFLYGNERIRVETTREGTHAVLDTSGPALNDAAEGGKAPEIQVTPAREGEPNYTKVTVWVPKSYVEAATGKSVEIGLSNFAGDYTVLKRSPLFSDIEVRFNGAVLPNIGATFKAQDHSIFANVSFRWGSARVYVAKESKRVPSFEKNVHFLSNGLWQFSSSLSINPLEAFSDNVPRQIYIDINPRVRPEDPGYPFDLSRQNFTLQTSQDFDKLLKYVMLAYRSEVMEAQADNFGQIRYLSAGKAGKPEALAPKQDKAHAEKLLRIVEGDDVTIEEGKLIVNGRRIPAITPDDLDKATLDLRSYKIDQKKVRSHLVMVHDNMQLEGELFTDLMRAKHFEAFDQLLDEIGRAFMDLRQHFVRQHAERYAGLADYAIGISFDKSYHGVHIGLPFLGAFVNPSTPRDVNDEVAGNEIFATMVHELVHFSEHHHGPSFVSELQRMYAAILSDPNADAIRRGLVDTVKRNARLLRDISEDAQHAGISTVGKSLEGREQASATGAAAGAPGRGEGQWPGSARRQDGGRRGPSEGVGLDQGLPRQGEGPVAPRASRGGNPQADIFGEPDEREGPADFITLPGRHRVADLAKGWLAATMNSDRSFNWWHRSVGTQHHKAMVDPGFGRVFWEGQAQITDTNRFSMQAEEKAPDILLRLEGPKQLFKRPPKKSDLEATANALFRGTLWEGPSPLTGRVFSDAELREEKLTEKQIGLYRQARAAIDESVRTMAKSVIARLVRTWDMTVDPEMALADVAAIAVEELKVRRENLQLELEQLGEEMEGVEPPVEDILGTLIPGKKATSRRPDLDERTKLNQRLDAVDQAIQKVAEIAERAAQLQAHGYMPLMRFGQFWVSVKDLNAAGEPEVVYHSMHESEAEARLAERELRRMFPGGVVSRGMTNPEAYRIFKGISPETIELFADIAGLDDHPLMQQFIQLAASERSALKRLLERKGTPGWSWDIPRVLATFVTSNARAASGNYHHAAMLNAIQDIPDRKGDVGREATRLYEYLTDPKEEAATLRGYLFFHFLGGSVASGMVNMTQPVLVTAPWLHQYAGAAKVAKELGRAMMEAARGATPPDAAGKALHRAIEDGVVAPHEIYQLMAEARGGVGRSIALRQLTRVWGGLFSLAEAWNRRSTFLAAFRIAQSTGEADPYGFAVRAVHETQFIYNKGNRPNWARGAIGATVFTFKQFSISYMEFLKRLPLPQRALALGLLVVASGLQGLPGADDLDDIMDTLGQWMGYATNSKKWKRRALEALLGKDAADFVLHGTSTLPGMPLDVQMRLGLGNLIPGTSIFKPSGGTDKGREISEVLGPAGGLAKGAFDVAAAAFRGDAGAAAKAGLPLALKNAYQAMEMFQTGEYRDTRGRRVIDVGAQEAFVKLVGFNPAVVASESRKIGEAMVDVNLQRTTEAAIATKWARGLVDKDPQSVDEAKAQLRDWNAKNPELKIVIKTSQLMQRVRDARRTRAERFERRVAPEIRGRIRQELRD